MTIGYLLSAICQTMAYTILSTCTACGLCLPECPIDALSVGELIYVIDQELCCDFEDCLAVCPVNAIVPSEKIQAQA
ncbi:MAG: DUF362 domain-containing protein, partial [Longimicrobiales bacterium]